MSLVLIDKRDYTKCRLQYILEYPSKAKDLENQSLQVIHRLLGFK